MGAKDFTDLICWQLARELNLLADRIVQRPDAARNRKFCEQLTDATSSATRNIAEGFGRYDHKEFANFLKIALGSEFETRNAILEAFDKGYVSKEERDAGLLLTRRAITAATRLRKYLLSSDPPQHQ